MFRLVYVYKTYSVFTCKHIREYFYFLLTFYIKVVEISAENGKDKTGTGLVWRNIENSL